MARRPRGYVGINHETIGSDILAVLKALHAPEQSLGKALAQRITAVKPNDWYPIGILLEALEALDAKLGTYSLRNVGWELFALSHAEAFKKVAKTARDLVFGMDGMYHRANRGMRIGGWKPTAFGPGLAILEKTTPHHCVMEEGILLEALRTLGIKAEVTQTKCFRKGAELCVYKITSAITDEGRWGKPGL